MFLTQNEILKLEAEYTSKEITTRIGTKLDFQNTF